MAQERMTSKEFNEKYDLVNRQLRAVEKSKSGKQGKTRTGRKKTLIEPVNVQESVLITDEYIRFVIPAVCPKPRMTQRDKWLKPPRDCVARYRQFRNLVQCLLPLSMPVVFHTIKLKVFIKMPDSWKESKKFEMAGKPHYQRPDADNILKAVIDCITTEDKAISKKEVEKFWGSSNRIEVEIFDF